MQLPTRITSNGFFRVFLIVLSVLLVAAIVRAQDRTADVDKIFGWATPATPGCACAVSQNGKLMVNRAYGLADLERGVAINSETIFDAGSLQKQFVAAAILILVEDKKLSLSDDIRKYIPELPDYGHKVTINHLLTHTSGVRDWVVLQKLAAKKEDAFHMIVRQRGLNFTPGNEFSYSNSGVVLAKVIVERASGKSFGDFTRERMFSPLGMKSTSYRDNMRDVIPHRALAYQKEGDSWQVSMLLDQDRGGGGILSTPTDLLIWNDAITNNRLGAFVSTKLQEPTTLNDGSKVAYGRGLFLESYRGTKEIWHSGSADSYKSFLARYPEKNLSVAIMCNSGDDTHATEYAHQIFDLFVADAGTPDPEDGPPPAVTGDAAAGLENKTGIFFEAKTHDPLQLAVDRGRFRIAGGPGLVPASKDNFRRWGTSLQFMSGQAFELNFVSPDEFELKYKDGRTERYRRAQSWSPTPGDLKTLAGRYNSDEIGAVLVFEAGAQGFTGRVEHFSPDKTLTLQPIAPDTFQIGRVTVCFRRDEAGKVVALDYSSPGLNNARFARL